MHQSYYGLLYMIGLMCVLGCSAQQKASVPDPLWEIMKFSVTCKRVDAVLAALAKGPEDGREVYTLLEKKVKQGSDEEKYLALAFLGRVPNRGQYRLLQEAATEAVHESVRCQALYSLGVLQDPVAVPFLLEKLACGTEMERHSARVALGDLRDPGPCRAPVFACQAVFARVPGPIDPEGLIRFPTLEEEHGKFSQWWTSKGEKLLAERHLPVDYWAVGVCENQVCSP